MTRPTSVICVWLLEEKMHGNGENIKETTNPIKEQKTAKGQRENPAPGNGIKLVP